MRASVCAGHTAQRVSRKLWRGGKVEELLGISIRFFGASGLTCVRGKAWEALLTGTDLLEDSLMCLARAVRLYHVEIQCFDMLRAPKIMSQLHTGPEI